MAARYDHNDYFSKIDNALKAYGATTPTLVIDLQRLNQNIDLLLQTLPEGMSYRLVAKSLPSPELIKYCCNRAKTGKLMTFSLPMLLQLSRSSVYYQQMLGKPLPVKAAAEYYREFAPETPAARNVLWLIDSNDRLNAYEELAGNLNTEFNIVLEIDVGLRRGGFSGPEGLRQALKVIRDSDHLRLCGLMGYDPHIPKIPEALGWRKREERTVQRRYLEARSVVQEIMGQEREGDIIRNAAGSPTFYNYQGLSIANEVSAGSVLVKPSDFDYPELEQYKAAAYIAAPALKVIDKSEVPGFGTVSSVLRKFRLVSDKTVFLYGGKWMADPVYPPNLKYSRVMGRSSNQEALSAPSSLQLQPDDFVFLRPTQSEFVLLQFGEVLIYDNGKITDCWEVYPVHG